MYRDGISVGGAIFSHYQRRAAIGFQSCRSAIGRWLNGLYDPYLRHAYLSVQGRGYILNMVAPSCSHVVASVYASCGYA